MAPSALRNGTNITLVSEFSKTVYIFHQFGKSNFTLWNNHRTYKDVELTACLISEIWPNFECNTSGMCLLNNLKNFLLCGNNTYNISHQLDKLSGRSLILSKSHIEFI